MSAFLNSLLRSVTVALPLTAILAAGTSYAGLAEREFNEIPEERKARMERLANELGVDLSTEEGRQAVREARREKKIARAAELGFDITTEEGREAFKEYRREQKTAHAAELGFDITTEEGREAFKEYRKESRQQVKEYMASLSQEERDALRAELEGKTREERREHIKSLIEG